MVSIIQQMGQPRRVNRRPTHRWNVIQRPWAIQPVALLPVLPNETLKNVMFQIRAVTDPVKDKLIGWHFETYWFYVKHRNLDISAELQDMVLDMSSTAPADAPDTQYFHNGGTNYTKHCLKKVVEDHFRLEGEAWNAVTIDGLPVASVNVDSWMDSLTRDALVPVGGTVANGDNMEKVSQLMQTYEFMRANAMINMSYEDFLASYGVRTTAAEENKSELLRYTKDWQYPSNTINPENGSATSAVSWALAERIDKDRYFKEPGFILGVQVVRPKVYFGNTEGQMAHYLQNAFAWMPAIMSADPSTSLKEFTDEQGPVRIDGAGNYWADLRDLFLYGDEFRNHEAASKAALPTATYTRRYANATDAASLFVSAVSTSQLVRSDGVCNATILGTQVDHT